MGVATFTGVETNHYPPIDLQSVYVAVGATAYNRGAGHVNSNRVVQCCWDDDAESLVGAVVCGNQLYRTAAHMVPDFAGIWGLDYGECTCAVVLDCEHVAALLLAAGGPARPLTVNRRQVPSVPEWRHSLDVLFGEGERARLYTPLAIEFALSDGVLGARLVRPGKRQGWVAGNLAWSRIDMLRYYDGGDTYDPEHVQFVRQFYAVCRTSLSYTSYGDVKTLDVSGFDSPQLWPLLDEARRVGVRLLHSRGVLGDVPPYGCAQICLDVSRDESTGDLSISPVLRVEGVVVRPLTFVGRSGHGVVYSNGSGDDVIRLARFERPAARPLRELVRSAEAVRIPADDAERFGAEYQPRLRAIAEVASPDGSFVPPTILGPELVVKLSYEPDHITYATSEWAYRVGDTEHRVPVDERGVAGFRDLAAERAVVAAIEAPLEQFGLTVSGNLLAAKRFAGMQTMRLTSELVPVLDGSDGVRVEIAGEPLEYREAGDALVITVSADAVPGEPDWFDLGVNIRVDAVEISFIQVFTALASGETHLMLPNGAYFALDKPELVRLRELIEEARALTDSDESSPRISKFQVGLFDELASLGVVERQAATWRAQVEGLRALTAVSSAPVPEALNADLRRYQSDGFAWLATLYGHGLGGILADDMGLGKTVQTIALLCLARQANPELPPFLVVAPSSVVGNWATECARFAPDLRVATITDTIARNGVDLDVVVAETDVVITTYTLFRLDFDSYTEQRWSGLILDEAQYVKNRQGKTYQCARKLVAPFKMAITGTPMENNLMELWSLLSITAPGLYPDAQRFVEYFARPIEKGGDVELLATFRRRIKPLVLRRTKELVAADLPTKQEQVLEVTLHPRHRKSYDKRLQRERQKILGLLGDLQRNRFTILRSLTALRQLALSPDLVAGEPKGIPSAKIEMLVRHVRDVAAGGHRALVFSQFTRYLGSVRDRLDAEGIDYCYLDGKTRDRARVIDKFKNGTAPVFLISLKAGGFGLNLTEADYCFLLDPWWNPATEAQAIDRTHRIGQTRNVMVYRLISAHTIEEKVMALSARKAKLFASVIDDGNEFGSALSADDIRGLLG